MNWKKKLRYLTHAMNSPKPHLLSSLYSSFIPNWKHFSLANPILLHPLPHTSLPISTPNTIAIWLSGSLSTAYRFVLVKLVWISWFPQLRFCRHCRNLEFTIMKLNSLDKTALQWFLCSILQQCARVIRHNQRILMFSIADQLVTFHRYLSSSVVGNWPKWPKEIQSLIASPSQP